MTTEQQTWIVMEGRAGVVPFWAWCRWIGGPGFEDLVLTATDGSSEPPEIDPSMIRLERYLFTVEDGHRWDSVELAVAERQGDTNVIAAQTDYPQLLLTSLLTEHGLPAVLDMLRAIDPDGLDEATTPPPVVDQPLDSDLTATP